MTQCVIELQNLCINPLHSTNHVQCMIIKVLYFMNNMNYNFIETW